MDDEYLEPRGRGAAILDEAVTWLHFEWGQNLPILPPPPGKQGVKPYHHRHHRTTTTSTHSSQPLLLGDEVKRCDCKLQSEEVAVGTGSGQGRGGVFTAAPVQ